MGYKIIVKKRFAKKLLSVLIYLEQNWSKKVADEFQDKIIHAIELISLHPYIGAQSTKIDARGLSITKHKRLFYRVKNNTIIIITLADTRRKNYTQ